MQYFSQWEKCLQNISNVLLCIDFEMLTLENDIDFSILGRNVWKSVWTALNVLTSQDIEQ